MEFNLRKVREAANLTQAQIAKAVSRDVKTVGNWEKNKTYPNAEEIWRIAELCNCSPNDIFGWTTEDSYMYSDPGQQRLNDCYENMNQAGKTTLVSVARSMERDTANRIVKDREERFENQQGA